MHRRIPRAICFGVLDLLILLYPRRYRRKYASQIRLTTTDLLRNTQSSGGRVYIWLRSYEDILKSAGLQHYKQLRPRQFVMRSLVVSAVLISPLLLACARLFAEKTGAVNYDGRIYNQQYALGINWHSGKAFMLWSVVLPVLSALSAGAALVVYYAHRRSSPRATKNRVRMLSVVSLVGLFVAASGFAVAVIYMNRAVSLRLADSIAASLASQAERPTLACKLFPLGDAQTILGKTAYMLNTDPGGGASGVGENSDDTERTTCAYYARNSQMGISVTVDRPKNAQALSELKRTFDLGTQQLSAITLQGYSGYYMLNGSASITLCLWAQDISFTVVAQGFEHASQTITAIAQNLASERAYAANNVVLELPSSLSGVSASDKDAIIAAVQSRNASMPAGTTYDIRLNAIENNVVTGTFSYGNGVQGTFAAEKRRIGWTIVRYKLDG